MPALSSHEGGGAWPGGVQGPLAAFGRRASLFGDGTYSGNVIQGGSVLQPVGGVITIAGAATVAPDPLAFACVVKGVSLVLDGAGASLKPSAKSKGLYLHLTGNLVLVNGATLNIDGLGKGGAVVGNQGEVDILPDSMKAGLSLAKLAGYRVSQPGAAGGAGGPAAGFSYNLGTPGQTGSAAVGIQTGGGGGGGSGKYTQTKAAGNGGPGTAFAGGGGGGGAERHDSGMATGGFNADAACAGGKGGPCTVGNGGPGSGGAGDPVGAAGDGPGGNPGKGGPGGILMAFVKGSISIASGCRISADGAGGGDSGTSTNGGGGGGAGGGFVGLYFLGGYSNAGTVRANGGPGGAQGAEAGNYAGGAGGAGGVATVQM